MADLEDQCQSSAAADASAASAAPPVRTILGTMTFAGQTDIEEARAMLQLSRSGPLELDTARLYENGKTEEMVGALLGERAPEKTAVVVATKVNAYGRNMLTAWSVRKQLAESLRALNVPCVDILYLHSPDGKTPIEETIGVMGALHKEGLFNEFGLSNFSVEDVEYIHAHCRAQGLVAPTVYQVTR